MKKTNLQWAKRFICLILVFCCTLTMSACSLSDITKLFGDFDASAYTKACLDAISKNDYTEYAKITNSTEEEAKKEYESLLDSSVNSLLSTITVSDETKQKVREMFQNIYSKWNYQVGEAVKNEDGSFNVPVTVRQLIAFEGALNETTKRFADRSKEMNDMSDSSYYDLFYQTFVEIVNETVAKGEYAEPVTIQAVVAPTSSDSNVYEIKSTFINDLYKAAMDMDALQKEAESAFGAAD